MSFSDVTRGQGSFVDRTKENIDVDQFNYNFCSKSNK